MYAKAKENTSTLRSKNKQEAHYHSVSISQVAIKKGVILSTKHS